MTRQRAENLFAASAVASLNSDDEHREDPQEDGGEKPYTREDQSRR